MIQVSDFKKAAHRIMKQLFYFPISAEAGISYLSPSGIPLLQEVGYFLPDLLLKPAFGDSCLLPLL
jgi:hypothetical protein